MSNAHRCIPLIPLNLTSVWQRSRAGAIGHYWYLAQPSTTYSGGATFIQGDGARWGLTRERGASGPKALADKGEPEHTVWTQRTLNTRGGGALGALNGGQEKKSQVSSTSNHRPWFSPRRKILPTASQSGFERLDWTVRSSCIPNQRFIGTPRNVLRRRNGLRRLTASRPVCFLLSLIEIFSAPCAHEVG